MKLKWWQIIPILVVLIFTMFIFGKGILFSIVPVTQVKLSDGSIETLSGQNIDDMTLRQWATANICYSLSLSGGKSSLCTICADNVRSTYVSALGLGSPSNFWSCAKLKCFYGDPNYPNVLSSDCPDIEVITSQPPAFTEQPQIVDIPQQQKPLGFDTIVVIIALIWLTVIAVYIIWLKTR